MPRRPYFAAVLKEKNIGLKVLIDEEECLYVIHGDFQEFGIHLESGNVRNHSSPLYVIVTDKQILPESLKQIISDGDPLLSVNGKNVLDEDIEVVESIVSTFVASGQAVDLVFLSLPNRSLTQYKTRISQPIVASSLIDELGFSYQDSALYPFWSGIKKSDAAKLKQSEDRQFLDKLWFDYLKSIGGINNIKPAGVFKPSPELANLTRRGLPAAFRPYLWRKMSLCDDLCKEVEAVVFSNSLNDARRSIRRLSNWTGQKSKNVQRYYPDIVLSTVWQERVSRDALKYIDMDLDRTFPTHPFFADVDIDESNQDKDNNDDDIEVAQGSSKDRPAGQESLSRILRGFAAHNPEIGYCQSMNFIAALCLLVERDEYDAFWLFTALMERIFPRYYFTSNMAGSFVDQHVLDHLLSKALPSVHKHVVMDNQIALPLVTTQWFLCCFLHTFTPPQALRIWDIFICEGSTIFFAIAIAVFKYFEKKILQLSGGDLFSFLREMGKQIKDIDTIIALAFGENTRDFADLRSSSYLADLKHHWIQSRLDQVPNSLVGMGLAHIGLSDSEDKDKPRMRSDSRKSSTSGLSSLLDLHALKRAWLASSMKAESAIDQQSVDQSDAQDFRSAIAELHESSTEYFERRNAQQQQRIYKGQSAPKGHKLNGYMFQSDYINGLREVGLITVTKNFADLQNLRDDPTDDTAANEPDYQIVNNNGNSRVDHVVAYSDEDEITADDQIRSQSCFNREDLQPLTMSQPTAVW